MVDVVALKTLNTKRWGNAKITRASQFTPVAKRLVSPSAKGIYQEVEKATKVPWYVIAVIHERESSQNWMANLAQGDPWNRVSTHVPAGRGPFKSWEEAAIDALVNCSPHAARNTDWSVGGTLTELEAYNGFGYASRGIPSPYVWSGTDQYHSGKYVRDGVFDANAVDSQLGCAGLILAMKELDSSITFGNPTSVPPVAPGGPSANVVVAAPAEPWWKKFFRVT